MKKFILTFLLAFMLLGSNVNAADYNKTIKKFISYTLFNKYKDKAYPTKKGSILVTPDFMKSILPLGHSAIVYDKQYVYEATSKGVVRGYNNWAKVKKRVFGLEVKGLDNKQRAKSADYAKKQAKKPYNYNFFNTKTRDKFYCSQLVWAAYYDKYKINLDTFLFGNIVKKKGAIHPMELVLSKNTKVTYFNEKK